MFLRFRYVRNQDLQAAVANTSLLWHEVDVDITNDESSDLSTVVPLLEEGIYTYRVEIRVPSIINTALTWFNLGNIYDPGLIKLSQTQFTVVEPTILDQYIIDMASTTDALINNPGLFEDIADNCNPISGFNALGCLTALFLPNQQQLDETVTTMRDYILTKAPIGYVTRLVDIMGSEATTSIPLIEVHLGSSSFLGETTYSVDIQDILEETGEILDGTNTNGGLVEASETLTFWEFVSPKIELLMYLALFLMILKDILGMRTESMSRAKSL